MQTRDDETARGNVVTCKLTGKPCKHADKRLADEGVYEDCRLCEVYESLSRLKGGLTR